MTGVQTCALPIYTLDEVSELVESLNDNVRVVDPESFIQLYSANLEHKNTFALRFRIYEGVWIVFGLIGLAIAVVVYKKWKAKKQATEKTDRLESETSPSDTELNNIDGKDRQPQDVAGPDS